MTDSSPYTLNNADPQEWWRQEISLDPTGTTAIFAMPGPVKITSRRETLRINGRARLLTDGTARQLKDPGGMVASSPMKRCKRICSVMLKKRTSFIRLSMT